MSTESGHWYNDKAESCHTIIGANGKERSTTIRDARKLGLFPSVSGILGVLDKGDLSDWKHRQITEAAFMTQPKPMETPEVYHSRIMEAAFKKVGDAADLGTRIHRAIEQHFQGEAYDNNLKPYVDGVDRWMSDNSVVLLKQELRLVNKQNGFAGTTDAAFNAKEKTGILDFKTRKTKPGKPVDPYDTQVMQIAAYGYTYFDGDIDGVNVYVSTTEIINGMARVEASWYTPQEVSAAWDAFKHAAELWRYLKKYDPRQGTFSVI